MKEQNGYKYNSKTNKIKKHFPASVNTNYDTYKNYLIKYECETDIRYRFLYFFDKDNTPFYDVIYIIKTENPHFYVDANNKTLCDTILICCNIKTFNILFELDICNPYYSDLTNNYPELLIKEIYNNATI